MPTKTTPEGREYDVDGKRLTWHPLDDNDEPGNLPDVTLPLRVKTKTLRALAGRDTSDVSAVFDLLEAVAPGQAETLDEMDVRDLMAMFAAWQAEYQGLNGATLGEASSSSV